MVVLGPALLPTCQSRLYSANVPQMNAVCTSGYLKPHIAYLVGGQLSFSNIKTSPNFIPQVISRQLLGQKPTAAESSVHRWV